jgi:polysaccharide biosynthesis/export protein
MFALLLAGCAARRPAPLPPPPPPGPYQIGPGDTLNIVVWREDKISGPVQVRPDGMISVPLIGDIRAAGLTPDALAGQIHAGLSRFIDNPNVVVQVTATGSRRFFVVGNVKTPGAYDLQANQTLLQALAVAGGFTDFADRNGIRIIRTNPHPQTVYPNYKAIIRGEAADVRLQPKDTIVVP